CWALRPTARSPSGDRPAGGRATTWPMLRGAPAPARPGLAPAHRPRGPVIQLYHPRAAGAHPRPARAARRGTGTTAASDAPPPPPARPADRFDSTVSPRPAARDRRGRAQSWWCRGRCRRRTSRARELAHRSGLMGLPDIVFELPAAVAAAPLDAPELERPH